MFRSFLGDRRLYTADDGATPTGGASPSTTEPTGAPTAPSGQGEKTFTQADVDRIIAERLERQKAALKAQQDKAAEDARAKALAEQGEYKALWEQEQAKAAELAARVAAQERAALLRKAAKAAGLDPDDDDLVSRLRGDTEAELTEDARKLAARLTPPAPPAPPTPPRGAPAPARPTTARPQEPVSPTQRQRPLTKF